MFLRQSTSLSTMDIGGGSRGGVKLEQHNLRDLLRMKEEDHRNNLNHSSSSHGGGGDGSSSGLTLLALFNEKYEPLPPVDEPLRGGSNSSRTLYDIIREDRMSGCSGDGGRSWRQLRDRIRRRQGGRIPPWSSAVPVPDSGSPFNNQHRNRTPVTRRLSDPIDSIANSAESTQPGTPRTAPDSTNSISHRNPTRGTETASGRFIQTTSPPVDNTSILEDHPRREESAEHSGDTVETANQSRAAEPQPARMSLMALLSENDRQMGLKRSAYVMYEDSKNAAAEDEGGGGENNCCVCMARQKGAAFIPCGHTFCRQCSRELWVQRGNCPICNNCILEILDIF